MILPECEALDQLPYFDRDARGKLKLADGVADKIIDFHTHLGWHFLFTKPVNQDLSTDEVLTFFPQRGNPLDLDHYASQDYTPESTKVAELETLRSIWSTQGFARTHTAKNLVAEMDRFRVTHAVILAIDFPVGPGSRNSQIYLESARRYPRLIPFVSVHPYNPFMEKKVRKLQAAGGVGMKIHPPMQLVRANNPRSIKLAKLCGELGLPCLYHSGASDIAPKWQEDLPAIKHFWKPVEQLPNTTFIFGHSGIHLYKEAIALGKDHPNVYLETSGQPGWRIREMIEGMGPDRILFGSDWPYYTIPFPLAKALQATDDRPEIRRKILYENAKNLLAKFGVKVE